MKNSGNTDEVGLDHLLSYGNDYRNMSKETVFLNTLKLMFLAHVNHYHIG